VHTCRILLNNVGGNIGDCTALSAEIAALEHADALAQSLQAGTRRHGADAAS